MYLDDLYGELAVGFEPEERGAFLRELEYISLAREAELGGVGVDPTGPNPLMVLSAEIGEEEVSLSPRLPVTALDAERFQRNNLRISPNLQDLMKRWNFFLVDFPFTLLSRSGWGFHRLEMRVAFNPDRPPEDQPVIYQIFPHEEWQDILHAWQGLEIGLDENLEFKLDPDQAAQLMQTASLPLRAGVTAKAAGRAGLLVGPFDYYIRRPKIQSQGRGNIKAIWRLEGEEAIQQKEPRLGVVLQVPRRVKQVDGYGVLAVYRKFHFFSTETMREVKDFLTNRTRSFFELGAPATAKQPWPDMLAHA